MRRGWEEKSGKEGRGVEGKCGEGWAEVGRRREWNEGRRWEKMGGDERAGERMGRGRREDGVRKGKEMCPNHPRLLNINRLGLSTLTFNHFSAKSRSTGTALYDA